MDNIFFHNVYLDSKENKLVVQFKNTSNGKIYETYSMHNEISSLFETTKSHSRIYSFLESIFLFQDKLRSKNLYHLDECDFVESVDKLKQIEKFKKIREAEWKKFIEEYKERGKE